MTIPVTGSTGTIGSQVVQRLAGQSERIRALVRDDASKVPSPSAPTTRSRRPYVVSGAIKNRRRG